jgi:hypothetical protein
MQNRLAAMAASVVLCLAALTIGCGDNGTTSPSPAGRGDGGTSFHVTAVTVVAPVPADFSGSCPTKIVFTGHITADGPGTVRFVWVNSDGGTSAEDSIRFDAAGTQEVVTNWTLGVHGKAMTGFQFLRVTSPNTMESAHADFILNCL